MEAIIHLSEIKEIIDTSAKNGMQFRTNFMRDYREKFGRFPKVIDVFERDGGFGCVISERDIEYNSLVSVFQDKPLVLRGYPESKEINDIMFDCRYHAVRGLDGELVSTLVLPSGDLIGLNKDSQIIDYNAIDSFMTISKLKRISLQYDCVVHGIISCGKYTALDISDKGNQSFYNKAMSDQIFEQAGLTYLKDISIAHEASALKEHGKLTFKVYRAGELQLFQKAVELSRSLATNHEKELTELLDKNYKRASWMASTDTYMILDGGNRFPQYSKELVIQCIDNWKKSLRHRSAEEIYKLDKESL